jgi:glycosyltransferase involved in cell wall biosynthesis
MSEQKECAVIADETAVPPREISVRLAYLIGHYPGVSLTFILREVRLLREMGLDIRTASINAADPSSDGFTEVEKDEQRRTFYVKARGLFRIAADHLSCIAARPGGYLRGLIFTLRLGGLDPRVCLSHIFYFAEAVVVGQWMRRTGLTHVHVHFANNTATVALIAAQIFPVKYSVSVHGPNEFYGVELYRLREKISGAEFLCCIGQYCRSQLMRITPQDQWHKFHVAPLGVDPAVFAPGPFPEQDRLNILCVGRLVPEKGQAVLITAFADLVERGHSVHLHVVGDGPSRQSLEGLALSLGVEHSVTFHGSMNQQALRALLSVAGIFVLPSFAEGIPVALMEAMAMEIPCVSTFVAGIPELIDSGENGILVPPSDPKRLSAAMESLITDAAFRKATGRAGRLKVLRCYNLKPNVEGLAGIFISHLDSATNR